MRVGLPVTRAGRAYYRERSVPQPERSRCHPEGSQRSCPGMARAALVLGTMATLWLVPSPANAQVGHRPSGSPYRDIYKGHSVTGIGGWVGGSGGGFGIGAHRGAVYGLRYDIRTASPLQFGLQFAQADLERVIVDPFVELAERVSGPVQQRVSFVEADLQLNLTGGKTWRRLAPFVGVGAGLALASGTAADTSGFDFGNKFYFAPQAGFRLFLTTRLHVRGEARLAFWKLNYPDSFTQEPPAEPGTPEDPNAVITDGKVSEWTTAPWLQAGLGYSFSF
jgi:hypothetical protein